MYLTSVYSIVAIAVIQCNFYSKKELSINHLRWRALQLSLLMLLSEVIKVEMILNAAELLPLLGLC